MNENEAVGDYFIGTLAIIGYGLFCKYVCDRGLDIYGRFFNTGLEDKFDEGALRNGE